MTDSTYSFSPVECVKAAWEKTKGAKGTLWAIFGMFAVALILTGLLSTLGLSALFIFILYIIEFLMILSLVYVGIRRAQNAPIHYTMIREVLNLRTFLYFVGYYLLQLALFIPAILLGFLGSMVMGYGQQQGHSTSLNLLAYSLFFLAAVAFFIIAIRTWLGVGFIVDKKLTPLAALKSSFHATKGNVWNIFCLGLIMILIMIGGVITLYIGMIWAIPWLMLIYGEAYKRLTSQEA